MHGRFLNSMNAMAVLVGLLVALAGGPARAQSTLALAPGDPAPKVVGYHLDGTLETIAWEGHTLINFWATWCEPCRVEMPELQKIQDSFADRGFRVVGVNREGREDTDIQGFLESLEIRYSVLVPHPRFNWDGISVLPTSYLVNGEGKIMRKYIGAQPAQIEGLRRDVEDVVNGREMGPMVLPEGEQGRRKIY